jgi:hypothetical protein
MTFLALLPFQIVGAQMPRIQEAMQLRFRLELKRAPLVAKLCRFANTNLLRHPQALRNLEVADLDLTE